ncbi:MAG: PepSY domain-containing protein [Sphingopyxis sp.]
MKSAAIMRQLARWHIWLGWLVAVPILLWTFTGLWMVARPIEEVRGAHLRAEPRAINVPTPLVAPRFDGRPIEMVMLVSRVDGPVWVLHFADDDARAASTATGQVLPDVDAALARRIADSALLRPGQVASVRAFAADAAPLDLRRERPSWQVAYADGLHVYVDRQSGEVLAVRSGQWRWYDVMWGLHILDPLGREDTHHVLLIIAAALAFPSCLIGFVLLFRRRKARPQNPTKTLQG